VDVQQMRRLGENYRNPVREEHHVDHRYGRAAGRCRCNPLRRRRVAEAARPLPNGAAIVAAFVAAGADVDTGFVGSLAETPLDWAANSDDVEVLDAGADVEPDGAVIGGGTAVSDATAFADGGRQGG
jgi:hypothetical protein